MDLQLTQQTIIITGGSSGIGLACAKLLFQEGANPVVWDLNAIDETVCPFSNADCMKVDITDFHAVGQAVSRTLQISQSRRSQVVGLVHAAAIGSGRFGFPFTNLDPDDWRSVLEVNVMGMVNVAHAIAPVLAQQHRGSMVFISSVAGQMGSQTDPPYSASKAANINFAQCMAKDLAVSGVRVNTVCPGMVQTPLNKGVWKSWHDRQPPELQKPYEEWAGEKVEKVVPLKRWQTVDDIANMVVFLLSNRAQEITGQTINVDGGFVMHW